MKGKTKAPGSKRSLVPQEIDDSLKKGDDMQSNESPEQISNLAIGIASKKTVKRVKK